MSSASKTKPDSACGACGATNESANQFCSGCGQSLWEKCPGCSGQALIGQNFCNQCGFNLKSNAEEKVQQRVESLQRCRKLADEGKLADAIRISESLCDVPDYRYRDIAEEATQFREETIRLRDEWAEKTTDLPAKVDRYLSKQRYKDVVALLEPIPESLLSPELRQHLCDSRQKTDSVRASKSTLKKALSEKDWLVATIELTALLEHYPGKEKYTSLMESVARKIARRSEALQSKGRYPEALEQLSSIPLAYQTESHQQAAAKLDELIFLRKLLAAAPDTTPLIGAAIDRLKSMTPDDERVEQLASRFARKKRTKPELPYALHSRWMKSEKGTFADTIVPSTIPASVKGARPACLSKAGACYWPALGLALQGIGMGTDEANLLADGKSGMLGLLARKRPTAYEKAWGIDIGDSSIKGILLSRSEDSYQIEDAVHIQIESESGAAGSRKVNSAALFRTMEKALDDPMFRDVPIVSGIPGSDLLARYLQIPVDSPKQHAAFIEQETRANIPINYDLLQTAHIKFPAKGETAVSQNVMLMALRKTDVESRAAIFKKIGLNLVSLTPEPIAFFNAFYALDFLDELETTAPDGALLVIDVGHARTSLTVVMRSGSWYRTIDWGVDDLATAIAKNQKLAHADADRVRRNLARSNSLSATIDCLNDACVFPKRELERSLRAAKDQLSDFQIARALLTGGGAYQALLGSLLNGEHP